MSRSALHGLRTALPVLALLAGALCMVSAAQASSGAGPRPASLFPDAPYQLPAHTVGPVAQGDPVPCGDAFDGLGNLTCNAPDPPLLTPGLYSGLQSEPFFASFDEDFYRVFVGAGQRLSVRITFSHAQGDAQMAIYSPACNILVNSVTANDTEFCTVVNGGAGAEYRIVVDSNGPGCVTYAMSVTVTCEDIYDPNSACPGPLTTLTPGTHTNLWANGFFDTGDVDWYKIHLRRSEKLTARARYLIAPADAEIDFLTPDCASLLAGERSGGNLVHEITYINDGPDTDIHLATGHYDAATCHPYDLDIIIEGTGNLDNTATYVGWSAPVVPRNDATATLPSTTVSATLDGNVGNTHVSWSIRQTGPYSMPQWDTQVLLDLVADSPFFPPDPAPALDWYAGNVGPFTVRGGRHTFTSVTDQFNLIHETNESDNVYNGQYVWSPLVTAFETPNVRTFPPHPGFGGLPNADGFEYTRPGSYAWVVGVAAQGVSDDYDLYVYDDYSGSTAGYSNFVQGSGGFLNATDFVVGHYSGTPVTLRPAAVQYFLGSGGTDFAFDQSDARVRNGPNTDASNFFPGQVMAANRLVDVYEAFMLAGSTFFMRLKSTSGPSDLEFRVYSGTGGTIGYRFSGDASSTFTPDTDVLTYTATVNGWHPIVVYRADGSSAGSPMTYDFAWIKAAVDAGDEPAGAAELAFLGAQPNPMSAGGRFEFSLPRAGHASVALYDAGGRLVRTVADGSFEAGRQSVAYDGRSEDGARLAAGVYWAMIRFEGQSLTKRMVQL
ncbi:MAG: FlgD immunoglobulin-like domain containing protein [Candidatus Eiseniibacteriota bacterium]